MKVFGSYVYDRMVAEHKGKFYIFGRAYTNNLHQWNDDRWQHIANSIDSYIEAMTDVSHSKIINTLTAYDVKVIYES